MHVCMTGPKTCPPEIGGIEVFVHELGTRLAQRGVRTSVVCSKGAAQSEHEKINGMEIHRVSAVRNRHLLKLSMIPGIESAIRSTGADVIHAHDATSGFLLGLQNRGTARVLTVHGLGFSSQDWPFPFRLGISALQKSAIRFADAVTTTDDVTASILKKIRKDVVVIPPGIDTSLFCKMSLPRPSVLAHNRVNLLFAGRLARVKGFDLLVEGIQLLTPEEQSTLCITVIGDGPLRHLLKDLSGTKARVNELGGIAHEFVAPYFVNSDMLVLPSRSEGMPITMLEAMSSCLPVISTRVGGIASSIPKDMMTVIEGLSASHVAAAIRKALGDQPSISKKAADAREHVLQRYSWDLAVNRYMQIYNRVTSHH